MRKLSVFILLAGISGLALPTLAQTFSAPPLQPNELIVKTKDDCGIVIALRGDAFDKPKINRLSNMAWEGLCIDGLAMGEGTLYSNIKAWAWYGRLFGEAKWVNRIGDVIEQNFFWDGKGVNYNTLDATKAVWAFDHLTKSRVTDTQTLVMTNENPYQVFVLNLLNPKIEKYPCPDPQSPSGCDAVWAKHAGPVIANIKAFISKNQAAAKAKKLETQALVEQFKLRLAACTKEGAASSSCPQTQPSEEQAHLRAVAQADVLKRAERQEEENKVRIAREAREKVEREQREAEERARLKAEADERERQKKLGQTPSSIGTAETRVDQEKIAQSLASRTEYTYSSVCERNMGKLDDAMRAYGIYHAAATYDLFLLDINLYSAKIFEPCKDTDKDSADNYAEAMGQYNQIKQYCAGPHQKWECTQWGASGGKSYNQGSPFDNIEYTRLWKREVDKALSDPNYSAEYGPIKWTGKSHPSDFACSSGLLDIRMQHREAAKNIPAQSVVALSEATLWKIAKATEMVAAKCPNSPRYREEVSRLNHTYQEIQRACDATSSSPPCVPRLPGKPSVSPPAAVAKSLPPLKGKPKEESCGLPPSANAVKCLEAKCAKQEGKLSLDKDGCAHCNTKNIGNYWFICPTGIGGAR